MSMALSQAVRRVSLSRVCYARRRVSIRVKSQIDNEMKKEKTIVYSPRLIALRKKADNIKQLLISNDDPLVYEELMTALDKVNQNIKDVLKDPLSLDYCIEEPWSPECKYFD